MALTLGDNFSYQGSKPLDGRLAYDTLAAMKAVADATMYNGCLAYCSATDKTYQWKSTNTVDEILGKWREFSSGGGGGSYTAGDGINITNDVISTKQSEEGDMDEIVDELPIGGGITLLTQTLTSGSTSVTFTGIPTSGNNIINFYTSTGINYTAIDTSTSGQVTLTFDEQSSDVVVQCEIKEVS